MSSTLSCMKKRRKSPNLPPSKPLSLKGALIPKGARPFHQRGAPFSSKGLPPQSTCTFPPLQTFPLSLQHQLIHPPPYLGHGGTTYPSTPFGMESSIAASWPQYGLLTTSQAVTMNPRSQWSLFEFGNRLNCEEICIQKFSCSSGGRGHFVLACLMG